MAAMDIVDSPKGTAGPSLNALLKRFAKSDPQNTQTVPFEVFNTMTNELGISGAAAPPDTNYVDGIITLAEACAVAGITLPSLPVGVNVLATYFRMVADKSGVADLPTFLKQLSYAVDSPANPEDLQVTFEEVVAKVTGDPCVLKLNVIKDSIRRWSREGNYRLDRSELAQFGRFFQLDLATDLESLGLKEILPLIIADPQRPFYVTGIDMDETMKAYEWCDPGRKGAISSEELAKAMRLAGINPSQGEFRKLKGDMDLNKDGVFDFEEFTLICCAAYVPPEEMRRKAMLSFDVFDVEKSGVMPVEELKRIFSTYGEDMSPEEIDDLFTELGIEEGTDLQISDFVSLLLT